MPPAPESDWIGVAEVAAEMNFSSRQAWELVKRLGVPMIAGAGRRMDGARFLREKWQALRDAAQRPAEPRAPRVQQFVSNPTPLTANPKAASRVDKLAALRNA